MLPLDLETLCVGALLGDFDVVSHEGGLPVVVHDGAIQVVVVEVLSVRVIFILFLWLKYSGMKYDLVNHLLVWQLADVADALLLQLLSEL